MIAKRIKHLSPEKVRRSKFRSTGHPSGERQFAIARLVTTPNLLGPYVILCRLKFQGLVYLLPVPLHRFWGRPDLVRGIRPELTEHLLCLQLKLSKTACCH